MPSGRVHLHIETGVLTLLIVVAVTAIFWVEVTSWEEAKQPLLCFVGAYLFSSLFLSPDMDLGRSDPQNRWGIFRVLWKPYAKAFSHRGISHNPLLGPLSRMLYLTVIVFVVWSGLHYSSSVEMVEVKDLVNWWKKVFNDAWLWTTVVGLLLPNELHILADKLFKN